MLELIRDAERRSLNVIALSDLLEGTDPRFRKAVIGALIQEGFDLNETLPCLQHPMEILEAIDWLQTLDFGETWDAFLLALLEASKIGILVDMRRGTSQRSGRRLAPLATAANAHHPLETA